MFGPTRRDDDSSTLQKLAGQAEEPARRAERRTMIAWVLRMCDANSWHAAALPRRGQSDA